MPKGSAEKARSIRREIEELIHRVEAKKRELAFLTGRRSVRIRSLARETRHSVNIAEVGDLAAAELLNVAQPWPIARNVGVYLLIGERDEILYIGQSTNVMARLGAHLRRTDVKARVTKAAILEVPTYQLRGLEAALIARHKPPLNIVRPPLQASGQDEFAAHQGPPTPTAKRWPRYRRGGW